MSARASRPAEAQLTLLSGSMLSGGGDARDFARAGIDFSSDTLAFDACGVAVAGGRRGDLAGAVQLAARGEDFWARLTGAASAGGAAVLREADGLAALAATEPSSERLAEGLDGWQEAVRQTTATLLAAPAAADELRLEVGKQLGEAGTELVDRLAWSGPPPAATEAVHDAYRLAQEIAGNDEAAGLVREMSGKGALRRLKAEHPDLHRLIARHVARFAWLRAQSGLVAPMTERELVQRISIALVRWGPKMLAEAAWARQPAGADGVGDDLPQALRAKVALLQELTTVPDYSVQALALGYSRAWPYLSLVGTRLGCPAEQLALATVGEIRNALLDRETLAQDRLEKRRESGFVGETDGRSLAVSEGGPRLTEPLLGQTGSTGRAVGRAKIIVNADDGGRLKAGDVLVTDLSTPTYEGEPSLFPYRTVPSVSLDKAAAVVTDEGGLLSHAGIICRENSVTSIIGTEEATSTLRDGQVVEVDATKGAGRIIVWSSPLPPPELAREL